MRVLSTSDYKVNKLSDFGFVQQMYSHSAITKSETLTHIITYDQ